MMIKSSGDRKMNEKVKVVLGGYLNLSDTEKRLFIDAIREYDNKDVWKQREILEEVRGDVHKIALGPLSEPCPCCGK